jgi:hypothetical protein
MAASACSDATRPEPGQPIDATGGVVAAFGDSVRLVVPAGALSATVRITIDRIDPPPAGAGLVPGTAFDLGPDGTTFMQPATLEIRYALAAVPGGVTAPDLRLHRWTGSAWQELPTGSAHDAANRRITGQITGFSRYAILPATAASVHLSDTALGPVTGIAQRTLVARARDVAGVELVGAPLSLTTLDAAVAAAGPGLVVRGVSPGTARLVLESGAARDTLLIESVFGWRAIRYVSGGNAPHHACGVGQDDRVYCWGENESIQGGRLPADSALVPKLVPGVPALGGTASLAVGTMAGCHSGAPGWVCWGSRRMSGEDALGNVEPRPASWLPQGRMHLGYNGACVTPADGAARCWGVSPGDGSPPSSIRWTPQLVRQPGGPWRVVRPGFNVVCGLTTAARAYCWGPNVFGSNGTGLAAGQFQVNAPNAVASTLAFDDVRPGADFACGLTDDGDVWCWGNNRAGIMGDTIAIPDSPIPVRAPVGALRFRADGSGETFGVGSLHACGLTSAGTAYCWGRGTEGALGSGSSAYAAAPVAVVGGHIFRALTVGAVNTCGITPYGAAYCWGFNFHGSLGVPGTPALTGQHTPALLGNPQQP